MKELIQYAQRQLGIKADGIIGPVTAKALEKAIRQKPSIGKHWPIQRKLIGYVQMYALINAIDSGRVDGYFGPQTSEALASLLYLEKQGQLPNAWRDELVFSTKNNKRSKPNPNGWPEYNSIREFYGKPGENLVTVRLPYHMRLAWNTQTRVSRITCHKKVVPSLTGILESVRDHYGIEQLSPMGLDLYGGMYNYRKMRGGNHLSTHAWGVAIDLDPAHNQLRWDHTKAQFAQPEYRFMLEAFAKEGWISLGQAKDFDWMHFQAVLL